MPVILSLDPADVPVDGETLLYEAASKKWRPKPNSSSAGPIAMLDYAVGDGAADDTAAVLSTFAKGIAEKRAVYSEPGAEYLVDELDIASELRLEGEWAFSARTADQAHVLKFTETVDWSDSNVSVNGKYRSLYGVRGADFARSSFGTLDVQRNKIWGFQFDPVGNNNVVTVEKFVAKLNGSKSTQTLTETAETANVLTSSAGYGTFNLATPLTAAQVASNVTYWVISGGLAYKVKSLTTTTIEIFMLKAGAGVGGTITVDIIIGGGLNLPAWGDNGVGVWNSMDIASNAGAGVHIASLYGHTFNNLVAQANSMGFTCSEYTQQAVLIKPYFENNDVNYVSWNYVAGVMLAPVIELETMQNCVNRLAGNGSYDPKLAIIKEAIPGLTSPLIPGSNPGSRTLTPGEGGYAWHKTAASTWTFVIDNHAKYSTLGAYTIMVDLSHASSNIACPISITLGTNNGQTIEGVAFGTPYTGVAATGKAILKIYRVGTDWKVTVTPARVPATSIAITPAYAGQTATVSGINYIATASASPADWKVASAAAITSISGTPSFIGQHALVAGVGYMALGTASSADWFPVTRPPAVATSIAAAPAFLDQRAIVAGVGYMAVGTASSADWKQITN